MAMDLEKGKEGKLVVTFSVIYDTTSHGDDRDSMWHRAEFTVMEIIKNPMSPSQQSGQVT